MILPTLFQTWSPVAQHMTGACDKLLPDTYTVVGINIKTEMVLSSNDEDVANSSKTFPTQD